MTDPLPPPTEAEGTSTSTESTSKMNSSTEENESTKAAMSTADALNLSLLQSDQERNVNSLQRNQEVLTETCNKQQNQITELTRKISELQAAVLEKEEMLGSERKNRDDERKRADGAVEMEKDANERMSRMQVEADALRQEIR